MSKPLDLTRKPASQRAEESVIGTLLRSEEARMEVLTAGGLEVEHFYFKPYRLVFEQIVERYYSDDPVDPLSIAEAIGPALAHDWGLEEREAVDKVVALAKDVDADVPVAEHARIIKQHSDYRDLVTIAADALNAAIDQERPPEEIAGMLSAAATRVVTGSLLHSELLTYADLGRRWTKGMQEQIAAKAAGQELGALFSIKAIDDFVKGLKATELMILGGDPGVGKSAIAWAMVRNFAGRQMRKPTERRVGTLVLSLEMGEELSSTRFAQMEAKIEGEQLRTAAITRAELREIATKWAANRDLPIIVNHSGELRETQIKALCIDAIRRHQIGLVVIDHFRFIKTDERFEKATEADDQIVKFLKATLAKDLNLAVICLAHTTKGESGKRPVMDDLRGSKMISAFADIVAFPYWPWKHASQEKRERGLIAREEYELIFDKVRQGSTGTGELWMDLSTMTVR